MGTMTPRFIAMSATQASDEDITITALDNEGGIWQGWKTTKQHRYKIIYQYALGEAYEPQEGKEDKYVYDQIMHWERLPLPGEEGGTYQMDIMIKPHVPPTESVGYAKRHKYQTLSVEKIS